jgi:hypothetical protein
VVLCYFWSLLLVEWDELVTQRFGSSSREVAAVEMAAATVPVARAAVTRG